MVLETNIKVIKTAGIVSVLCLFVLSVSNISLAQTNSQKKSELQSRLETLNSQIKAYQENITETRKKQASLSNEIKVYDAEISSTELQIQANETRIENTTLQIEELKAQIERRKKEIADNKNILAELVVQLYQQSNNSVIQMGLGTSNFSSFLDELQYTQSLQGKVYQLLQHIKDIKTKLEAQTTSLEQELKQLEDLKEQLEVTQESLAQQRRQKDLLLSQTRSSERTYQKMLTSSKNEKADLQKEIDELEAASRAKGGKKISGGKGLLAWPMDGVITQRYGNTGFTSLGYNFHSGIDIAAPAGEPIYASADGVVNGAGSNINAAYGIWASVKHNLQTKNGLHEIVTVYAHMRSSKVRTGQSVKQGDLIGYEGNTGNTTRLLYGNKRGYHIHFMVCAAEGFNVVSGSYAHIYGPYSIPTCFTYNPLDFL